MTTRIGIFGGTFDPIHCGHLDLGDAAQRVLSLSTVIVIPSHVPPHRGSPMASRFHRFAMVALAISDRSTWRVSDSELSRSEFSYTASTLRGLHAEGFQPLDLYFLI